MCPICCTCKCCIWSIYKLYSRLSFPSASDQPVGVGFSHAKVGPGYFNPVYFQDLIGLPSEECPEYAKAHDSCGKYSLANATTTSNSTSAAASNFWKAIQGFMGAFPQYSRHDFHFATESFGGVRAMPRCMLLHDADLPFSLSNLALRSRLQRVLSRAECKVDSGSSSHLA